MSSVSQHFISILPNFDFLFEFEPNLSKESRSIKIEEAKKRFHSINFSSLNLDDFPKSFKDFPIFIIATGIVYISLNLIEELTNPKFSSTKEMKRFKSNNKYLSHYINSFSEVIQLYKNLNREEDYQELEEIINIFKNIKDDQTRHETIQWLITEYLTYIQVGDISYQELFPKLSNSWLKKKDEVTQKQLLRRVHIYQNYFDGFDISKEDIYRSMLIKLYHLYAQYGTNKGRGDANPDKHIETIVGALRNKNTKISPKKMKSIYIKGFFSGIAIFDYKTEDNQKDAIDDYFKLQHQSPLTAIIPNAEQLMTNQRQQLLNELILR